ncbi:MAG: hypothetical protein EHM83_11660 [Burkholderiales bacterium]|nr:MAG: hypothetical protein EHM83_11660 [Burkholderiales bacterium]
MHQDAAAQRWQNVQAQRTSAGVVDSTHASLPQHHIALEEGVISNLPMFRQAGRYLVAEIVQRARQQFARRGSTICTQGQVLPGLFAVAYGAVKLSLRRPDRDDRVLRLARDGDTFFDAAALLGRSCPTDAVALADSLLIVIPTDTVYRLIDFDPKFARIVVAMLAERALGYLSVVAETRTCTGAQRVASCLESLAEPVDGADVWLVRLPAAKKVLASQLGMTKESLSRHLRDLSDSGVIAVAGREITVLDRARLLTIVHDAGASPVPARNRAKLS